MQIELEVYNTLLESYTQCKQKYLGKCWLLLQKDIFHIFSNLQKKTSHKSLIVVTLSPFHFKAIPSQ